MRNKKTKSTCPEPCAKRSGSGFTMIEVLVSVAIMISLLTLTLTYTRKGSQQVIIFRERARLMQEITRARSLAAALFKERTEKVCGYGVLVENSQTLILFKDLSSTGSCFDYPGEYIYNTDEEIDEFVLDEVVSFNTSDSAETILFVPPKPELYFDGEKAGTADDSYGGEASISIYLVENPAQESTITVNQLGQISTE